MIACRRRRTVVVAALSSALLVSSGCTFGLLSYRHNTPGERAGLAVSSGVGWGIVASQRDSGADLPLGLLGGYIILGFAAAADLQEAGKAAGPQADPGWEITVTPTGVLALARF